jgi:homoserine kinase type II
LAVYTEISDADLEAFVAEFAIGGVLGCKGIAEGVENSNFLLQTEAGSYILTLYEKRVDPKDLPFFLGLMEHLAASGLPCPLPVHDRNGEKLKRLAGRPAALMTFLNGLWPRHITARHCLELGKAVAALHVHGQTYSGRRANTLGVTSWAALFEGQADAANAVKPKLADMLTSEIAWLERNWPRDLPAGIIHADLFPDNVFFQGERISGLIDFYFACSDFLAYDLAICMNAWCFEPDASFNITKARNLLWGYHQTRPLTAEEFLLLPVLARGAAMRFLLTRLYDWGNTPAGALVKRKDPLEYEKKLRFHAQVAGPAEYGFEYWDMAAGEI